MKVLIANYKDGCENGLNCTKSHGWKECEFHPDFYRTTKCQAMICRDRDTCSYYHNEKERREKPSIWFKIFPKCRTVNFSSNFYAA